MRETRPPSHVLRCLQPLHPGDRLGAGQEGLLMLAAIARTRVAPELSRNSLLHRGPYCAKAYRVHSDRGCRLEREALGIPEHRARTITTHKIATAPLCMDLSRPWCLRGA